MGVGVGESLIKAANGARQTDRRDEDPRPPPTASTTVLISDRSIPVQRDGVLNPEK